jgi:hypothetical protein
MNREVQKFARCIGTVVNPCRQLRSLAGIFCTLRKGLVVGALLAVLGCSRSVPRDGFVFTQSPLKKTDALAAVDALDLRYPAGSRVMLADSTFRDLEILTAGLLSAGDPQVTYDGQSVVFCAKASRAAEWQIYEVDLANRQYRPLTTMPGGAASPALLPDGRLLFVSPVDKVGETNQPAGVLYAQARGQQPQALTFTSVSVSTPSVLEDGRILFVGTRPRGTKEGVSSCALYTINNDGTEIAEFSRPQASPTLICRPRQIGGNRIIYLVSEPGSGCGARKVEFIRCARPFASPECLSIPSETRFGSVQPAANGELLVSAGPAGNSASSQSMAIYRANAEATTLGQALFADPARDTFEVNELAPHSQPMGRLSTVDPAKSTGQILCLNVNYTSHSEPRDSSVSPTARVRIVAEPSAGRLQVLGEVPVQADGSFMAEVPADVPLGLEALNDQGQLLRRLAPMIWVRPGENRSCLGCHEPPNHAPGNHRPLAVRAPVPKLTLENPRLAQAKR